MAKQTSWGWLAGLGAAVVVMSCIVGFEMFNSVRENSITHTPPRTQAPTTVEASSPAVPITPSETDAVAPVSYPLAKSVEVTGFRFLGDKDHLEMRYLVVNHSAAELGEVTVYVTVRSANSKPGQAPLYRFSFKAPSLGPFESKDMATTLDRSLHGSSEWQGLRADVELGQ